MIFGDKPKIGKILVVLLHQIKIYYLTEVCTMYLYKKKASWWMNKIFHFGSEIGEEQLTLSHMLSIYPIYQCHRSFVTTDPELVFQDCSLNLFFAIFKRQTSASVSQITFVPWLRNLREKNNISQRNCSIVIWFESLKIVNNFRQGFLGKMIFR